MFEDKVNRIFLGQFPNQFKDIDAAVQTTVSAIRKQEAKSVFEINYAILIQDIGELLLPNLSELLNNETSDKQHNQILY